MLRAQLAKAKAEAAAAAAEEAERAERLKKAEARAEEAEMKVGVPCLQVPRKRLELEMHAAAERCELWDRSKLWHAVRGQTGSRG